mmetsp:Transcript_17874/g.18530  ORF Transcript_17874/g.18530 Transcript_17874/m.18530 type:complete len:203 (-) Transcript_17874:144-752(-)
MSQQQIINQMQEEISQIEHQIQTLKSQKQTKEYLVDDLRDLLGRVSEESSFLTPFRLPQPEPTINLRTIILAKSTRKYSDQSSISDLSKCASHTTKASSINNESHLQLLGHHQEESDNLGANYEGGEFRFNYLVNNKRVVLRAEKTSSNAITNGCGSEECGNVLDEKEVEHYQNCFRFWRDNVPQKYREPRKTEKTDQVLYV